MPYQFPPDVEQQVAARLAAGGYASEDDVLRQALKALEREDEEVQAIQAGIDDMEAGRVRPLSEFDREFRRRKNITRGA